MDDDEPPPVVEETPQRIAAALAELEVELQKIPDDQKAAYLTAVSKDDEGVTNKNKNKAKTTIRFSPSAPASAPPLLVDDDHKLLFLRSRHFHAAKAADRMVRYWNQRLELFGETKAYLPLTQQPSGAFAGETEVLRLGLVRLLPHPDPHGRSVLFVDPGRLPPKGAFPREAIVRANWYVLHAALTVRVSAQTHGVVMVAHPRNAKLDRFDQKLAGMMMGSIKDCLPVRVANFHICHPPSFFRIIVPIMKFFMGKKLRKRLCVHFGTDEEVLERLAAEPFGLTSDILPTDLGGKVEVDQRKWLENLREAKK